MPRTRAETISRSRHLSSDRLVSAELIVRAPDGREVIRAGGVWSIGAQRYVRPPEGFAHEPHVATLTADQVAAFEGVAPGIGLAGLLRRMYAGDPARPTCIMVGGKPGGGKTYVGMLALQLLALAFPGDGEIAVCVLNTDNRRECIRDLDATGRPEWTEAASSDGETRNPFRRWITGVRLSWISAKNPKKLRQRGLPWLAVVLNEAQLMPASLNATAQIAPRSRSGFVLHLLNPPTETGGNWASKLWQAIREGEAESDAEIYDLDNAHNPHINRGFMRAAGRLVRLASPDLAAAEVDGIMRSAGRPGYPTFDGRPYNLAQPHLGGCVGDPPAIGWQDVTAERTARDFGDDGVGAELLVLVDFQKDPGVVGNCAKLYRVPAPPEGCRVCAGPHEHVARWCAILYVYRQIAVRGTELAFSQALFDAGYAGNGVRPDGTRCPRPLLIGDGTGARQSAAHDQRRTGTTSFQAMKADGWHIRPPDYHWKSRIPWNPAVPDSLRQMEMLFHAEDADGFRQRHILISPRLREPVNGFPALVASFRDSVKTSRGKLDEVGNNQHGPDGVRYGSWLYLARPKAEEVVVERNRALAASFRAIRLSDR